MLKEHPVFQLAIPESGSIWKFMDFTKFVSLLATNSLWCARPDTLGDPFEGAFPQRFIEHARDHDVAYRDKKWITASGKPPSPALDLIKSIRDSFFGVWR